MIRSFTIEPPEVVRAVFFGLGADGTVGANKNSVKIIAEDAGLYAQGYFVYDSHKSGAQTVSHLRFGPRPIRAPYLIRRRPISWPATSSISSSARTCCGSQRRGAPSSSTAPMVPTRCGIICRARCSSRSSSGELRFFVIDASKVAQEVGLRGRTNTILQTCFFAISGVLPRDEAIIRIKESIRKTYADKGRGGGAAEFPGGRRHARPLARSKGSGCRDEPLGPHARGAGGRARIRPRGHRQDVRRRAGTRSR